MEMVDRIAEAVLYEGYLLYPYRRSAMKNQQRWTFGGIYPPGYSEVSGGADPWSMQTQCLVLGDADTALTVRVRFLQVVDRTVAQADEGSLCPVEELRVGDAVYRPWEEAIERTILVTGPAGAQPLLLGDLCRRSHSMLICIPAGDETEVLTDATGTMVGMLRRTWRSVEGGVEVTAEPLAVAPEGENGYRITVRIANTTAGAGSEQEGGAWARQDAIRQTFVSTHTILTVQGGAFVSLLEPPAAYQRAAEHCRNLHTWPVIVGAPGERHTLLSSPIILYDYPQIAPESPGNLFDATEIDELLTLSIMTLTDEEKQEMRESDARGRQILERTESLTPDQLMKLHGVVRGLQAVREEER